MLTERTGIHELQSDALDDRIKTRNIQLYDLDILENDEIIRLSSLLDFRGLWGERIGSLETQKLAFLKEDCGRQLQAFLMEVAKSPRLD